MASDGFLCECVGSGCRKRIRNFWNNQNGSEEHDLGRYTAKVLQRVFRLFCFHCWQCSLAGKAPVLVPVSGSGSVDNKSPADPGAE